MSTDNNSPNASGVGCGWKNLPVEELMRVFGDAFTTVHSNLKKGVRLGIFKPGSKIKNGIAYVALNSLKRIKAALGIEDLGAALDITLDELRSPYLRFLTTDATAEDLQRKSMHAAREADTSARKLVPPEDIISSPKFRGVRGFTPMDASDSLPYGCSQAKIARTLSCSDRTIRRRLSDRVRRSLFVPCIAKTQVIIPANGKEVGFFKAAKALKMNESETIQFFQSQGIDQKQFHSLFTYDGQIWSMTTNVYALNTGLRSLKSMRYFLQH